MDVIQAEKSQSGLKEDLFYCIDEGGAFAAEDALEAYLRQINGDERGAETQALRMAVSSLVQDQIQTDPELYRLQRLDAYRELIGFGLSAKKLTEDTRISLVGGALSKVDNLLLGEMHAALEYEPDMAASMKEYVYSRLTPDNRDWVLALLMSNRSIRPHDSATDTLGGDAEARDMYPKEQERTGFLPEHDPRRWMLIGGAAIELARAGAKLVKGVIRDKLGR